MPKRVIAALAAAGLAAAAAMFGPWTAGAGTTATSSPQGVPDPSDFSTVIDNPYFPFPVGRQLVYRGTKDGVSQKDVVTVTDRTKTVALGITARVVTDVATHNGKLLEKTEDWYAQDSKGNVWYVGEDTAAFDPDGTVDTSGSWEAGV